MTLNSVKCLCIGYCYCLQNGLSMDENTYIEALKLFKETKHQLSTNVSSIGNGTVNFTLSYCIKLLYYMMLNQGERIIKQTAFNCTSLKKLNATGLHLSCFL